MSTAESWFAGGARIPYTPELQVFVRREGDLADAVSFMPGFPDGSFGWASVLPYLPHAMPKLFFDYIGMGDSDKPKDYPYSTAERTDLVEAMWRKLGVRSTTLVAFDFSSLVILEHLRRRLEGKSGPQIRGVFIFNGGLYTDGHSHPWYTTPVLRRLPRGAWPRVGRSFALVKRSMWSKGYHVADAEVAEVQRAMARRDGLFYLAAGASFVADHQAQGDRLDFGQLYKAYRDQFPFLIGGSTEDPFERRQLLLAKQRLGLPVEYLPGGHLTTHEQPEALAALIARFEETTRRSTSHSA